MQLVLNLTFTPAPFIKRAIRNNTWQDAGWAAACLGFTQKVEISRSLCDALDHGDQDQQLYDVLWLTHHHLVLDQRSSFSFTFDFLREDKLSRRLSAASLRLHVEEKEQLILLGLIQDFQERTCHSI